MATIKHSMQYTNVSIQNGLRYLVQFLTTAQAKAGHMWEVVYTKDDSPATEFGPLPIAFILKKALNATGTVHYMYVKVIMDSKGIAILVSSQYNAANDNNTVRKLTGSWKSLGESTNDVVSVYDHLSAQVLPSKAFVPEVRFDSRFNPSSDRVAKFWIIRKLGPKLDEVTPRKLTDIFAWVSFCTEEIGTNPIEKKGFFQHFGFGCAGDILLPDTEIANGAGLYAVAGSFAGEDVINETAKRVYAGGPSVLADEKSNIGCVVSCGHTGPWGDTAKPVWFYANTQYGYCRMPFDDDLFIQPVGTNVGFDFTELCKYSAYSGVRTLTPAYIYGGYDNLHRILMRIPVIYTSLEGLYAGDIISQDKDGVIKNFMIFPFHNYLCATDPENKLGYAINVPTDEEV